MDSSLHITLPEPLERAGTNTMTRLLSCLRFLFWSLLLVVATITTVRIVYMEALVPSTEMVVEFTAPAEGTVVLLLDPNANWRNAEPIAMPTIEGRNRATFRLTHGYGEIVRWDPGVVAGTYEISAVSFARGGETYRVDLETGISSPEAREMKQALQLDGTRGLVIVSTDSDPQLLITVPSGAADTNFDRQLLAVSLAAGIAALSLAVAFRCRRRWNEEWIAIGFVVWLYLVFAFYVAKIASRLPFWDDWRYLREVDASGRLPITPRALFRPFNDTVGATGKFIDATMLNATGFNFFALQMFGVLLLGVYIVLMITLIRIISRRLAPAATPYAILLVSLSLVAMSYWIEPAVAYHQFLPLLFATPILLLLRRDRHVTIRTIAVGVFGLLAGFAYISGALMMVAMGAAFLVSYVQRRPDWADLRRFAPGLMIVATGLFTFVSQIYLVSRFQGSLVASSSVAASAFPWEPEFWAFYLGMTGRALGLRSGPILAYLAIVAALLLAPVAIAFIVRWPERFHATSYEAFVVFFAAILVPAYTAIVSFGRAGMGGDKSFGSLMVFGAGRFHFWWIAALIPLVWIGWVAFLRSQPEHVRTIGLVVLVLVTLAIAVPKTVTPWNYPSSFANRELAFQRTRTCVTSNILEGNVSFTCRHASSGDIGPQLRIAYKYDMTFIRQVGLPDYSPVP